MKLKSVLTMTYLISLIFLFSNCSFTSKTEPKITNKQIINKQMSEKTDTAIFGAGFFWCFEAIFQRLKGVESIESGYTGGTVENPTYKQVCTGETGHAEVTKIIFNPDVISFNDLLEVFWTTHDPTTLNQQGADIGTQYRSAVFYLNDEQKMQAEKSKSEIATQIWDGTIVTEITPLKKYYKAEDYHQNYFNQNSDQSYCRFVINPKLEKFRKKFKDKIKDE